MVNIRHTLEKLNHYNEEIIVKIRSIHFKKRTWISLAAAIPDEMYRMLKAHYIDQKKEDVLYYFKRHRTHEKPLTPITRNDAIPFRGLSVKSNSYILKYLVSFLYAGSIDFIEKKLERMTLNSKQSFEQAFVETASDISIYLEFKHCHVPKIASILYELRAFNYSKTKLEKESAKIRREQKLYLSSALITYLESKQIPKNRLPAIVEGIIMLEDYFLNHSQLFNTL